MGTKVKDYKRLKMKHQEKVQSKAGVEGLIKIYTRAKRPLLHHADSSGIRVHEEFLSAIKDENM